MIPKFYDRENEIRFLNDIHSSNKFSLVVIYGRRRVGKTELLKHFLKGKRGIYFLSVDESIEENIKSLRQKFAELTGKEYFLHLETKSFYDLFKHLANEMKNERIAIIIDEFPYLLYLNRGLLSLFQKIIDEILIDSRIMLILCGSSMSVMESDVLGHKTPLYGRNVNPWKLLPFDFRTVLKIHGDIRQAIEAYFVFGGIPYYLNFYDRSKNIFENIKTNLLTKGRNLYDEPFILLRQEFRESRVYRLILKYISLGYRSLGKICSSTGMDKSNIMKYLSTLQELGIVKHVLPLGMKRKGVYEIVDPLFRFWFRYIYPHRDILEMGNIDEVERIIRKDLNSYFGLCFEHLIEELLAKKQIADLSGFRRVSRWWHRDMEIDLVALNEQSREILFAECKWQDRVNAERVVEELFEKSRHVEWNSEGRKESFAVFAKSFARKTEEFRGRRVFCFGLKELERALKGRRAS